MESRGFNPVKVGLIRNFLKPMFIVHPLFKIIYCNCYDKTKLLKPAVFQTPLFTCLEPKERSLDINIKIFMAQRKRI